MFKKFMFSTLVMCVLFAGPGFATLGQEEAGDHAIPPAYLTRDVEFGSRLPQDTVKAVTFATYKDSNNQEQNLTGTFQKVATQAGYKTYELSLTSSESIQILKGNPGKPQYYGQQTPLIVKFDDKGKPISFDGMIYPPNVWICSINMQARSFTILTELKLDFSKVVLK